MWLSPWMWPGRALVKKWLWDWLESNLLEKWSQRHWCRSLHGGKMTTWLSRWMPTESLGFRKLKSSCLVEPTTDFNTICSFHSSNTGGSVLHPSAESHGHVELVRWINKNMYLAAQTVSRQDDHPIRLKPDPSFQGLKFHLDEYCFALWSTKPNASTHKWLVSWMTYELQWETIYTTDQPKGIIVY